MKTPNVPEIRISYKPRRSKQHTVANSLDAYGIIQHFFNRDTIELLEETLMLLFDRNNQLLGWTRLGIGGMHNSVIDQRLIFGIALKAGASAIMLAHNHPSGNLEPSKEDIVVTQQIKDGCHILGLLFYDHLIVAKRGYFSFSDKAIL